MKTYNLYNEIESVYKYFLKTNNDKRLITVFVYNY